MDTASRLKALSDAAIDAAAGQLAELSRDIWSHPELNYEEKHAHSVLTAFLEGHGILPQRHYVVDTAFRAEFGGHGDGPNVAVMCEYDALPELGHACGHNLIAEVGAGAALGIKAALEAELKEGRDHGKLTVLGTPAEEGGGGKIKLMEAGAFRDIDCTLMAHPAPCNLVEFRYVAVTEVKVIYKGKASHAAASPWEGINALDAAVTAYSSISCLRQQMKPDWRVHGVITNGGVKPNIVPEEAELIFCLRAPTLRERDLLEKKVYACFNAAATASGCSVEIKCVQQYDNMVHNETLASVYRQNMASYGLVEIPADHVGRTQVASSDVGNVSQCVPSISPIFAIGTNESPHCRGFLKAAGDPAAQSYALAQSKLLAATAIDLYCRPQLVDTAKEQIEKYILEELQNNWNNK